MKAQTDMVSFLFASDGQRWTSEHYGLALEQAFVEEINEEIGIREFRQIQAALIGHYLSKWTQIFLNVEEITFEQQGHTTATHDREYDRAAGQTHGLRQHSQLKFELASIQWQLLVFPSSVTSDGKSLVENSVAGREKGENMETVEGDTTSVAMAKSANVDKDVVVKTSKDEVTVALSALRALRKLLSDNKASFRSEEQAQATALMLLQADASSEFFRQDLLVVLPTGMGKTLTWLVAGELEDRNKLTIVIVPLNALLLDLAARLSAYGQSVHLQDPRTHVRLEGLNGFLLLSVNRIVQQDAIAEIHRWEHRIVSSRHKHGVPKKLIMWTSSHSDTYRHRRSPFGIHSKGL